MELTAGTVGELLPVVSNYVNGIFKKEDYKRSNKIAIDSTGKLLRIVELTNTNFITCKLNYISNAGTGSIVINVINHESVKRVTAKLLYGDNIITLYYKGSIGIGESVILYAKLPGNISGVLCSDIMMRYSGSVDLSVDSSINEQDLTPIPIQ